MQHVRRFIPALIALFMLIGAFFASRPAFAGSYTVYNTNDTGPDSLRSAINQANASLGPDTITFAIDFSSDPGCNPSTAVCTITPASPLPILSGGGIVIDGYTQTNAAPAAGTTPAVLKVVLDGSLDTDGAGFNVNSANNEIKGFVIRNFDGCGVYIYEPGSTGNIVAGNHIGTDTAGTAAAGNGYGVCIIQGASGNTVGGDAPADRNVISGNGGYGVYLNGEGTDSNVVSANYIGVTSGGGGDLGNAYSGVLIENGAANNIIGGATAGERNVISGNDWEGVYIVDPGTDGNEVYGNYIGTNRQGTAAFPNERDGVLIEGGAGGNIIGGVSSGFRNVISGNIWWGITVEGAGSDGNTIAANYIGVNAAGDAALSNGYGDVVIRDGAQYNTVGGDTAGERNVISGEGPGVSIGGTGTDFNVVSGNYIGPNAAGDAALSSSNAGVYISSSASYNTIGGDAAGEGNLISGQGTGVVLEDEGTIGNTISGNLIGTDAAGTGALGNIAIGVEIRSGPQDNTIGGDTPAERNVISANTYSGVSIGDYLDAGTSGNVVSGNFIGTDITGTADLGNGYFGVEIDTGAVNTTVGGAAAGTGNVISGNESGGITISDAGTTGTVVRGNFIGTDASGTIDLGNEGVGVSLFSGASGNTIGPGNKIAFNGANGVLANGAATLANVITQNSIFANNSWGITLQSGAHDNILAPTITGTSPGSIIVSGTATDCDGCTIEVFSNTVPFAYVQGKHYLGSTTVTGTGWSVAVPCTSDGYLTATATDAADGTSEFSNEYASTVRCLFLPLIKR